VTHSVICCTAQQNIWCVMTRNAITDCNGTLQHWLVSVIQHSVLPVHGKTHLKRNYLRVVGRSWHSKMLRDSELYLATFDVDTDRWQSATISLLTGGIFGGDFSHKQVGCFPHRCPELSHVAHNAVSAVVQGCLPGANVSGTPETSSERCGSALVHTKWRIFPTSKVLLNNSLFCGGVTQVDGSLYVVYNMGLASQPVGELEYKVNDGNYHVMRFTRQGQNASVQLDDRTPHSKHPPGQLLCWSHDWNRTNMKR